MSDPVGVQYKAHSPSHSESRQERAERESREKAMDEFRKSPAAREIEALRAELLEIRRWKEALHGRGGVVITGTVVDFSHAQSRQFKQGIEGVSILDEGTLVMNSANTFNFVGGGVVAELDATNPRQINVTITGGDGSADIAVTDEGDAVTSVMTSLDVVGSGLTATSVGGAVTLTYAFTVQQGGSTIGADISTINFTGSGVSATAGATADIVNVAIAGDTTNPTNSGAGGANTADVLKTGTNVVARQLKGTGLVQITQGTDDITLHVDETTLPADKTAVFFQYDGTDISAVVMTFPATVDGAFAP